MASYLIEGGQPVSGEVTPSGNKNEALPAIAASLLCSQPLTFKRMPKIQDVLTMCDILSGMGATCHWSDSETLTIDTRAVEKCSPDANLCAKIRASILFLGPLLSRFGFVQMPLPGGDVIGARRIDTHFEGIEALGGEIKLDGQIQACLKNFVGQDIYLDEPSVTATENLILLAAKGKGTTTLHNAACEPHVVGLCNLINEMGGNIRGIGSNRLEINGVKELYGCVHEIGPDFMEVGSFICLGAIGGGKLKIKNVKISDLRFTLKTFQRLGIQPQITDNEITIDGTLGLEMKTDISGRVGSIYSGPWPAFPTDLMSVAIVCATQAKGTMIFHEKMFEGRMFFTDKLMSMGANIVLCDPHRIVVNGPSKLNGGYFSSPDVRAGMAMIMAAIVAKGQSTINNIYQVERGYFNIEKKLSALGINIKRIDD